MVGARPFFGRGAGKEISYEICEIECEKRNNRTVGFGLSSYFTLVSKKNLFTDIVWFILFSG